MINTTFNGHILDGGTFNSSEDLRPRPSRSPYELGGVDGTGARIATVSSKDGHFDVHEDDSGNLYGRVPVNGGGYVRIGINETGRSQTQVDYEMEVPSHLETHLPGCSTAPGHHLQNGSSPPEHWEAPSDYSVSAQLWKAAQADQ